MPKQRSVSVSKQCEECGEASPVACRNCTSCGSDFHAQANEKSESPDLLNDSGGGVHGERRRSERVKREKPDYYDSLDFENKRRKPERVSSSCSAGCRREKATSSGRGVKSMSEDVKQPDKERLLSGRAMLTWNKGETVAKKKRKPKRQKEGADSDEDVSVVEEEDLPLMRGVASQVFLSEINRKLGLVMFQPG